MRGACEKKTFPASLGYFLCLLADEGRSKAAYSFCLLHARRVEVAAAQRQGQQRGLQRPLLLSTIPPRSAVTEKRRGVVFFKSLLTLSTIPLPRYHTVALNRPRGPVPQTTSPSFVPSPPTSPSSSSSSFAQRAICRLSLALSLFK